MLSLGDNSVLLIPWNTNIYSDITTTDRLATGHWGSPLIQQWALCLVLKRKKKPPISSFYLISRQFMWNSDWFLLYTKNWATRLANPSRMRKLWKTADGQLSVPCRFWEIMCTRAGKMNTRARPHVAPENL